MSAFGDQVARVVGHVNGDDADLEQAVANLLAIGAELEADYQDRLGAHQRRPVLAAVLEPRRPRIG